MMSAARQEGAKDRVRLRFSHRTTFSRRVDKVYADALATVRELLAPAIQPARFSLTMDLWSQKHSQIGYLAVLISFITDDWRLVVAPVAMEPFVHQPISAGAAVAAPAASSSSAAAAAPAPSTTDDEQDAGPVDPEVLRHDARNISVAARLALERVGVSPVCSSHALACPPS
jgi:hypothetical protein